MHERAGEIHKTGKTIGLVPTMGYFHQGHLSLMKAAREEADFVVVSLFVNPIQFGPAEDFVRYPRDLKRDMDLAKQAGVDILFNPTVHEMYHTGFLTHVKVDFDPDENHSRIGIRAAVRTIDQTGVEMEALTAVSVAALTLYDMCKSYDREMRISDIQLLEKSGGKSGMYKRIK